MRVRRFFADEVTQGIIEVDPRARRTTTLGFRPGSLAGEAMRFVMQFKGWPVAFTQRVLGRQFFARRAGSWDPRQGTFWRESAPQIGNLARFAYAGRLRDHHDQDAMKATGRRAIRQTCVHGWPRFSRAARGVSMATSCSRPATATAPTSPAPCRPNAPEPSPDLWNIASDARDFAVSGGEDPVVSSRQCLLDHLGEHAQRRPVLCQAGHGYPLGEYLARVAVARLPQTAGSQPRARLRPNPLPARKPWETSPDDRSNRPAQLDPDI